MTTMLVIRDTELLYLLRNLYEQWYSYTRYSTLYEFIKSLHEMHKLVLEDFNPASIANLLLHEVHFELNDSFNWYDVELNADAAGQRATQRFQEDFIAYFTVFRMAVTMHARHYTQSAHARQSHFTRLQLLETLEDGSLLFCCR